MNTTTPQSAMPASACELERCAEALRRHGFDAVVVATPEEAFACMKAEIEQEQPCLLYTSDAADEL